MDGSKIYILDGRVIDPANHVDKPLDVFIDHGKIKALGDFKNPPDDAVVIDAAGCWVLPGFIDLHTHLREPGQSDKETLVTGMRAAAAGGFTTLCCMPDTSPCIDSPSTVKWISDHVRHATNGVNVLPISSITRGQHGFSLVPMHDMVDAGVCAFSEDEKSVANTDLLRDAMGVAMMLNMPIFSHCEDTELSKNGVVSKNAGERFGLPGISIEAETVMVERDIALAIETGAKLHICHVSTALSVELIREAKKREPSMQLTAETCPHYFAFSDEAIKEDCARFKVNPPLRSREDRMAVLAGLRDGTISIIATDHAPHHEDDKNKGLLKSDFGIVGLETAVSAGITCLINTGILSPSQWVTTMTINPANVLGIDKGHLGIGTVADVTVIDPGARIKIDPARFHSMGRSTPFAGVTLNGSVEYTLVNGQVVWFGDE